MHGIEQMMDIPALLSYAECMCSCARCAVGDISNPIVHIEDLDINIVADFCELFAQASALRQYTIKPNAVQCATFHKWKKCGDGKESTSGRTNRKLCFTASLSLLKRVYVMFITHINLA